MQNLLDNSQTYTTESLFELLDADTLLVRAAFDQTQHLFENNEHINANRDKKKKKST